MPSAATTTPDPSAPGCLPSGAARSSSSIPTTTSAGNSAPTTSLTSASARTTPTASLIPTTPSSPSSVRTCSSTRRRLRRRSANCCATARTDSMVRISTSPPSLRWSTIPCSVGTSTTAVAASPSSSSRRARPTIPRTSTPSGRLPSTPRASERRRTTSASAPGRRSAARLPIQCQRSVCLSPALKPGLFTPTTRPEMPLFFSMALASNPQKSIPSKFALRGKRCLPTKMEPKWWQIRSAIPSKSARMVPLNGMLLSCLGWMEPRKE
mmetsp:Transcript_30421/g.71227  ORF Transcript_30421/g.71227 Transcript_30421/m.71227 type:complete len:267 (+) Transcript_30421:192-992(+)